MSLHNFLVKVYIRCRNIKDNIFGYVKTKNIVIGTKGYKKAFLVGTPKHDNLGDHAIAYAEIKFIRQYFPEYEVIEIPVEEWHKYKVSLKKHVNTDDVFFITGGGNMGDVYLNDEILRRFIIKNYINNAVVVFPQLNEVSGYVHMHACV